jgi:cell fate (sporulation/competence/biofilm development) regulator YlbF (YheA/YmcA/DUF963 family)
MTQASQIVSDAKIEEPAWRSAVESSARDLAAALAETPEFMAFERAHVRFRDDEGAQEALWAYREQQSALQTLFMLNAVGAEQRAELERLREVWMAEPSVKEYLAAQAALAATAQAVDQLLSERIGLGFAAACRPSCCG